MEARLGTDRETAWFSLQQRADLFGRDKSVVARYLGKIYGEGGLDREATAAKSAMVQRGIR